MTEDPYTFLGRQLTDAAKRHEAQARPVSGVRAWLSRRMNAPAMAVVVVLAGGAVAAAATGVLTGSPVPREGSRNPNVGIGVPAVGNRGLLGVRAPDPEGGLAWGMRVVHTTRGEVCVQIGRVDDGRLGQLGIDGAFHDDGRFHPLAPVVLPNYGASSRHIIGCVLAGQTIAYRDPSADRSADPVPAEGVRPPTRELRSISFGLLGPHAMSVTYQTKTGMHTQPVVPGVGAYLIVRPSGQAGAQFQTGGAVIGDATGRAVSFMLHGMSAITYRLGSLICSVGSGAPVGTQCPITHSIRGGPSERTRHLSEPVNLRLIQDTPASCKAAFLNDPCYRAEIRFRAPYAVTSAGTEYGVEADAQCKNAPVAGWVIDRDVKQGEVVRAISTSSFSPSACSSSEKLEILYSQRPGPSTRPRHESVVVGDVSLGSASDGR